MTYHKINSIVAVSRNGWVRPKTRNVLRTLAIRASFVLLGVALAVAYMLALWVSYELFR